MLNVVRRGPHLRCTKAGGHRGPVFRLDPQGSKAPDPPGPLTRDCCPNGNSGADSPYHPRVIPADEFLGKNLYVSAILR